jgi:hypothetical protein
VPSKKTAGRPVAPLVASLVAFARKWVGGTPWPMTCCCSESRPPRYLASFPLPAKLQPNFRTMGGGEKCRCRCKTHVLSFFLGNFTLLNQAHNAAFLRLR